MRSVVAAGLALCRAEKEKTLGKSALFGEEERTFKIQLVKIFGGEEITLAARWGPNLSPNEVFAELPEFDALANEETEQALVGTEGTE